MPEEEGGKGGKGGGSAKRVPRADVAKHNYSIGPAGVKSAARCSLKRASANPGLMEPARCGRRAKKWTAGPPVSFLSPSRDTRVSIGMPGRSMTSNARHARRRSRHDRWILCQRTEKPTSPRSISLNARPSLRKFPFDVPFGRIDTDDGNDGRDEEIVQTPFSYRWITESARRTLTIRTVYGHIKRY